MIRTELPRTQQHFFEFFAQTAELLDVSMEISTQMNEQLIKTPPRGRRGCKGAPGERALVVRRPDQSFVCAARVTGHPPLCWRSSATSQRRLFTFISKMIP